MDERWGRRTRRLLMGEILIRAAPFQIVRSVCVRSDQPCKCQLLRKTIIAYTMLRSLARTRGLQHERRRGVSVLHIIQLCLYSVQLELKLEAFFLTFVSSTLQHQDLPASFTLVPFYLFKLSGSSLSRFGCTLFLLSTSSSACCLPLSIFSIFSIAMASFEDFCSFGS